MTPRTRGPALRPGRGARVAPEYTDNVVRQDEFTAAHPGTVITCDAGADPLWPWTATLPGVKEQFTAETLGSLMDMLERAAKAVTRDQDREMQGLKDCWGEVCDFIECDEDGVWRTRLRGGIRELTAASGDDLDAAIRAAIESGIIP